MSSEATIPPVQHPTLPGMLGKLAASGWHGFEGLVTTLLREATGLPLLLAGSGLQGGLDAATPRRHFIQIAVECKRYGESRPLSSRELRAEIDIACDRNAELDCWILVASREVTTQEDEALEAVCSDRGIAYLSLGTAKFGNVGLLEALCAQYEDAAVGFLESAGYAGLAPEFVGAVRQIREAMQYSSAVKHLDDDLAVADIGFGSFAKRLNQQFLEDVSDRAICRRRFRCALTPASLHVPVEPIRRVSLVDMLQQHWASSQSQGASRVVLVLGDEGSGKSWVVADWLSELAKTEDAPGIFYVPAVEPKSNDARQVLVNHAQQFALTRSTPASVARKLDRWLNRANAYQGRRAVVVLDGINERVDADLWLDLIEEFLSDRMSNVHLVVTCRTVTWNERFRTRLRMPTDVINVGDFSDSEFAQLISGLASDKKQAIRSVGSIVRRPRYFHLAIHRAGELRQGEELTAETLYYLDWQHRELLRRDLPVDSTEFAEIISGLARDERAGFHIDRATLEAELGVQRFVERQGELSSSSVLERTPSGWRLRREYFALGLGMYLAARIEERGGTIEERCAAADELFADTSVLDLSTSVLQHALLHTLLSSHSYDRRTQIALLHVWGSALNAADTLSELLPRLPMEAGLLLDFAEHHWGQEITSHVMEQAVLSALIRVMRLDEVRTECSGRLQRWASLVHEYGERELPADGSPREACHDVIRLCADVPGYEFPVSRIPLLRTTQQPAVKLGRLAIAAVSATSVREYWKVVEAAFISDQAMGGPRTELLAWLVRWCHESIDDLVDQTSSSLLADRDAVSYRAAQRLISILGSQALLPRLTEIPAEHFPINPWAAIDSGDPCLAFFRAPCIDQLPGCLGRIDVPWHLKADRAAPLAADLDFPFPPAFAEEVARGLRGIDAGSLRRHMGHSDVDHALERLQPLGLRLALPEFAGVIRRLAVDCASRTGMPLRQASFTIEEFSALLDEPAVAGVRSAWERIVQGRVPDLPDAGFVESLFACSLLEHMDGAEQIEMLRQRGGAAHLADSMGSKLKKFSIEQQQLLRQRASDPAELYLTLWMLNAQQEVEPSLAVSIIEAGLASGDSACRGQALRLMRRLSSDEGSRLIRLHVRPREEQSTPFERYFRTVAAVLYEKPEASSVRCVSPEFLGQALVIAPVHSVVEWSVVLAELLFATAQQLLVAGDLPTASMEVESGGSGAPWRRLSNTRSRGSRSVMFSAMSTWGGLADGGLDELFEGADGSDDVGRTGLEEALSRAALAGNWVYGALLPVESVKLMADHTTDFAGRFERLVNSVMGSQRSFLLLQPIVEVAVEWAFAVGHPSAFAWYDELEAARSVVRFKNGDSGLLRRHLALLRASPCDMAEKRWRDLVHAQTDDLTLYRVIGVLADSNRDWVLDEASREIASGSPRGRALGIVMTAMLEDPDDDLHAHQARVCGEAESWYDTVAEMAWQYVRRGRDQAHWVEAALFSEDPLERVRGAAMCEYLGHPTLAREIDRTIRSRAPTEVDAASVNRLPGRNGHSREWSEWTKSMSKRLLGSRVHEHAIAPWLPAAIA